VINLVINQIVNKDLIVMVIKVVMIKNVRIRRMVGKVMGRMMRRTKRR